MLKQPKKHLRDGFDITIERSFYHSDNYFIHIFLNVLVVRFILVRTFEAITAN